MIILDLLSFSATNTAAAAAAQARAIAATADRMATENHAAAEDGLQRLDKVNLGNSLSGALDGAIEPHTMQTATTKTAAAPSCRPVCKCKARDSELRGPTKRAATNVRQNDGQNVDMGKSVADNDDNNASGGVGAGAGGGGFGSCDSGRIEMVECAAEEVCERQRTSQIAGTAGTAAFAECDTASAERAEVVGCPEQQRTATKSLATELTTLNATTTTATTTAAAAVTAAMSTTLPAAFRWLDSDFSCAEHKRQQQNERESGRARVRARARTFGEDDNTNNGDNGQNNCDGSGNGKGSSSSSSSDSGSQSKAVEIAADAKTKANAKAAPSSIEAGIGTDTCISPRSQSTTFATTATATVNAVSGTHTKDTTLALPTAPTERTKTALGATENGGEFAEAAARRRELSSFQLATSEYEYITKCLTPPADEDVDVAVQPAAEENFSNILKSCKTAQNYQPNACGANSRAVWPSENKNCVENSGLDKVIIYANADVNSYGDCCYLYNFDECCSCEAAKSVIGVGGSAIGTVGAVSLQFESNKKTEKFEGPLLAGHSFLNAYAYCPHQWRGRWNGGQTNFANSNDKDEKQEKIETAEVKQKEAAEREIVVAGRGAAEGAAGQFSLLSTRRTGNGPNSNRSSQSRGHSENRNQSESLLLALAAGQRTIAAADSATAAGGRNRNSNRDRDRDRERGHSFHIHSTNLRNQRIHNLHNLTNFVIVTSARRPENLLILIDNELVHNVNEHIYLSDKCRPVRILVGLKKAQQAARAIATAPAPTPTPTQSSANCTARTDERTDEVVRADLQTRAVGANCYRVINGSARENVIDNVNGNGNDSAGWPVKQTAANDQNEEEEKRAQRVAEAGGKSADVRWKAETESASNECDKWPERGGFNDVAATAEYRRVHNSSKPPVIPSESRDGDGENTVQVAVGVVRTGEVTCSAYEWSEEVGAKQTQKQDYEHLGEQQTQTQKQKQQQQQQQQQQLLSGQKAILDSDSSNNTTKDAQALGVSPGLGPLNTSWHRTSNANPNANANVSANDYGHATSEEFEASQRLQRLQQHFRGLVCMPRSHLKFDQSPNNNYSGAEASLTHANARQTATATKKEIPQDVQRGSAEKRKPVEDTSRRTHERSPLFSAAAATTTTTASPIAATTTAASSAIQLTAASREAPVWNEYRADEGSESAEKETATAAAEHKGECALSATATVAPPPPCSTPTATAALKTAGEQSYVTAKALRLSHCATTSETPKLTTAATTTTAPAPQTTATTKTAREEIACKQSDVCAVGCALQESSDLSLTTAVPLSTTTTAAAATHTPSTIDTRIAAVATLTHCTQALQHIANAKEIARNTPVGIERAATPTTPPPPQLPSRLSAFVATKPLQSQRILTPHERQQQQKAPSANFTYYHPLHGVPLDDSFTEFDVRQLSELIALPVSACSVSSPCLDSNHNLLPGSKRDSRTVAFECYDELLEEVASIGSDSSSACDCDNCERVLVSESTADRNNDCSNSSDRSIVAADPLRASHNSASSSARDQRLSGTTLFAPNPNNNNPNTDEDPQKIANKMREVSGQLRGLLKKPNRPPPARKNRVVFDETRNEFFEADYIILIREDCAYDEEDEEPCTCGEHELVRLCCEEGCQCNYSSAPDETRTPQSPKYAPPIEFVDEAALSPPDGYKDNGLKNTLGGALSGHIFGAQHIQQLQVIQRLQQQRAAMLAARNTSQIPPPPPPVGSAALSQHHQQQQQQQQHATAASTPVQQSHSPDEDPLGVCTECAECAECAAKQLQDAECTSPQCQEELAPLGVPAVALLPLHTSSPERRITQKEIIAGEERPKYVLQAQYKPSPVTERRIVREAMEDIAAVAVAGSAGTGDAVPPALPAKPGAAHHQQQQQQQPVGVAADDYDEQKPPPIPPKETSPSQISGILKGGKLWKQDSMSQSDDQNNTTSEDEGGTTKRSVRFVTEDASGGERDGEGPASGDADDSANQINELIPIKKHSTLFNNALRPNSAVRQLFPSVAHQTPVLTSEALRAFDESKRGGCLVPHLPGSGDTDTIRRSIERNILRRSLIKKKAVKSDISLEERIKQLTCDIDEVNEDSAQENGDDENNSKSGETGVELAHRGSPMGEENPQKFANGNGDKSFSPSSSVSSSSSGSSAYKKISDIFNRDKKQEKILEMEENPIVIIPQECRCPAAPDLGMGIQVPVVHTQIHRTPPRQAEPKRQFLSTLAPLTACVAGNKDDLSSYYTLAAAHHSGHAASNAQFAEFNMGNMGEQSGAAQSGDEIRKVAPDVIAGTPGQEQQDELAAFAQQEANRTEKIKKRYTNENSNSNANANASSDDDEQNDYGFNKRPSVRGIKPKFSSTNEILQQMQEHLNQQMPSVAAGQPLNQAIKSYTLPKQSSTSSMTKQISQNPSPQNVPHPMIAAQQQQQQQHQQQQQQQQMSNQQVLQMPANAIAQQQTEQRSWSFYAEGADQQQLPAIESGLPQAYYQTLPAGTMFRQTMIQHGQDEASLMYAAQNCQSVTAIEQQHYGHYARSPTRRPESPPPLRNYHQTMVLIPYNAETYSQFAATNNDPKVAHIQRQNILEYQQVTQQTIRVPIGYALPGMQLHVVAGRGHATHYAAHTQAAPHPHQPHQRIMAQRYQFAQEGNIPGFSERGVPEGAAAVSHTDCNNMVSPTGGGQQTAASAAVMQQLQQQLQQQQLQQQQQQQLQQQQQQQQQPQQGPLNPTSQAAAGMQAAQGSVYYAMNV